MNDIYDISRLIQRHISGATDEEERARVEAWAAESKRHRQMMESFREEKYWQREEKEHRNIDTGKAFRRFLQQQRRERRQRIYYWTAAAAIVLIIGIVFFSWQTRGPRTAPQTAVAYDIKPGSSKAVLVLGNGIKMELKDSTSIQLSEKTAHINIEKGHVSYQQQQTDSVPGKNSMNTVYTPSGGEYKLTLADGTRVWLNANSKIYFPAIFKGEYREVTVEGEVYFEVAKDSIHPFLVHTGEAVITVIGTSFNVRHYPEEAHRITLAEGKVKIEHQDTTINIHPGQQWIQDEKGIRVQNVDAQSVCRWKDGAFVFKNSSLKNVFREIERWYNIHVFYGNSDIEERPFTGIFPRYGEIERVVEIVELATCVKCSITNKTITIYADN